MSPRDPSLVFGTVLSNLVPLVGVVLLGWNAITFVAVYWADIVVSGFWGACRTLVAEGRVETDGGRRTGPTVRRRNVPEAVTTLGKTWKLAGFVGVPLVVLFVLTGSPGSGASALSRAQFALGVGGLVIGRGVDFAGYLSRGAYRDEVPSGEIANAGVHLTTALAIGVVGVYDPTLVERPVAVLTAIVVVRACVDVFAAARR